jgi:ribose transport system substrate-binding protein
MRRRGIAGTLVVALACALAACGSADDESDGGAQKSAAVGTAAEAKLSCNKTKGAAEGGTIAYMPPGLEFAYYIAIQKGLEMKAKEMGYKTFTLAPQSGADIEGQVGMLQDVLTRDVDGIILSSHDEKAAAPLVKRATDKGVAVVIVNSDIADFPTPINAVVGYRQRPGTRKIGQYAIDLAKGEATIGVIEGQPGYHSTERVGGFLDAIKGQEGMEVVAKAPGDWNVEGGNRAAMDMLQAHPEITMIFAANDYMAEGAAKAAKALGKDDLVILGNDGDTTALEQINEGELEATVNTTPVEMGETAMKVMQECLEHKFKGFYVETPSKVVDKATAIDLLREPERLWPRPSRQY